MNSILSPMPWVRSSWSLRKSSLAEARRGEGFRLRIDTTFRIEWMLMKTTSMIILGEDLGEEDEVGEEEDPVEVVEVATTQGVEVMEMAMEMALHLIHLAP